MIRPACLDCSNFSRWEQPTGGTVPRCCIHPVLEAAVREEMSFWFQNGRWLSSYQPDELPAVPPEDEEDVLDESDPDIAVLLSIRDWLDSNLTLFEKPNRPVFRSVSAVEEDVMWRFHRCPDFRELSEEEQEWDRIYVESFHHDDPTARYEKEEPIELEPLVDEFDDEDGYEDYEPEEDTQADKIEATPAIMRLWDVVDAACP